MNIEEIAQGVANSFYAMEAGHMPTESWEMPTPSSGDMQIAVDLMPLVKRAQAEALREAADSDQAKMFSSAVYVGSSSRRAFITARDWLHSEADRIESEVPDV